MDDSIGGVGGIPSGPIYRTMGLIAQHLADTYYAKIFAKSLRPGDIVAVMGETGEVVAVGPVQEVNFAGETVKVLDKSQGGGLEAFDSVGQIASQEYGSHLMQEYSHKYSFYLLDRPGTTNLHYDMKGEFGGQRTGDPMKVVKVNP